MVGILQRIKEESTCTADYLQLLANKFGDFKIATCYKQGLWTKHYTVLECWTENNIYSKSKYSSQMWRLDIANQRQILSNEIIIDIDHDIIPNLLFCVEKLEKLGILYEAFSTGSKGYHIHIIFSHPVTTEEKRVFVHTFHGDAMKVNMNTLIALEFVPHWKSGKIKEVVDIAKIRQRNIGTY